MKGLNQAELEQICEEIQAWVGSQLQEVVANDSHVALGFYHDQEVRWMMFDFATQSPVFLLLDDLQVRRLQKQTKPLTLFIRAHFEGRRLQAVALAKDQGRVVNLSFHSDESLSFEIILFSFAKNFTAHAGHKKIHFFKPKELVQRDSSAVADTSSMSVRSFHSIQKEWLAEKGLGGEKKSQTTEKTDQTQKQIQKKTVALEKMLSDILQKSLNKWGEAGEWLKMHQTLKVADEFKTLIDPEKTLSQNIEICFQKAKDQERKLAVARERAEVLKKEVDRLTKSLTDGSAAAPNLKSPPPKKNFLQRVGAQARTLKLDDKLVAYIGKSAKDNLDILRRAQPFDLWLHIRDTPSAHVIVRRTRERQVTDLELRKIGAWLISENFGKKAKDKSGETFDLIVCECRFVKPIKGDKLSRVNFQNDRTVRLKFEV